MFLHRPPRTKVRGWPSLFALFAKGWGTNCLTLVKIAPRFAKTGRKRGPPHRYAYVGNNPINAIDPLGLTDCPQGKTCSVTIDGEEIDPTSLFGRYLLGALFSMDALQFCPGNDCSIFDRSFPGANDGSFTLVPGPNGLIWINNLNGEELSDAAAAEVGLFADNGGLPAQLPLGTPQRFWNPFTQGLNEAKKRVQKKRCSAFFGGQGLSTLEATQYRFLDLGTTAGGLTNPGFSVFLNSNPNGPFMNPPRAFLGVYGPVGIRAIILLHELGHELRNITGFVADAGRDKVNINLRQSRQVVDNCF